MIYTITDKKQISQESIMQVRRIKARGELYYNSVRGILVFTEHHKVKVLLELHYSALSLIYSRIFL